MKLNKIYNKLFVGSALFCAVIMTSCEDYLTLLPTDSIPDENFWESKTDVYNVRAAAYYQATTKPVIQRILYWGEYRSDNMQQASSSATMEEMMNGTLRPDNATYRWSDFYTGISYCNKVLERGQRMIDQNVDPTFSLGEWRPIESEMKSLRALYYFYLVRAFHDVPLVTTTISTDAQALELRKGQPVTPATQVMEFLINELRECKNYGAINYGNTLDNKGRFTRWSTEVLLADMLLWQACLLKNGEAKGYTIKDEDGNILSTQAQFDQRIESYLNEAVALCTDVLNYVDSEYREKLDLESPSRILEEKKNCPYPLYRNERGIVNSLSDNVYATIWGSKNSRETILDLQYDGVDLINSVISSEFYTSSGGSVQVSGNNALFSSVSSIDKDGTLKGFSKTDSRYLQSVFIDPKSSNYPIRKNVYLSLSIKDWRDMSKGIVESSSNNLRKNESQDSNWPIYHLSDVMLIKAECIARLHMADNGASGNEELIEGYRLVNELFKRYNPCLYATGEAGIPEGCSESDRLRDDYAAADNKTGEFLLGLVYRERQREFFAEGKRWFDLVRQAEYLNNAQTPLESWANFSGTKLNRQRKMEALYSPYYIDEMKANPALVQNPVWDKYTPNSSKPTGK